MSKVLTSIFVWLFIFGLAIVCQSFGAIDPATAVGIWLFEGNANDSSENGNDGELMKGAKFSNEAKFNKQALSLDGKDDYVLVETSASLESTSKKYTGVAWVKFKRKGGKAPGGCCQDDQMVIAFSLNWHNILNVFGRGGRAIPGVVEVGSSDLQPSWFSGPTSVDDDKWHHIVFTYDGASKVIYVDGKVDGEQATKGDFGVFDIDLLIGGTPTGERPSNGLIDDVGIFNVALAEADIKKIMNDGLARSLGVKAIEPKDKLTTIWARIKFQR